MALFKKKKPEQTKPIENLTEDKGLDSSDILEEETTEESPVEPVAETEETVEVPELTEEVLRQVLSEMNQRLLVLESRSFRGGL